MWIWSGLWFGGSEGNENSQKMGTVYSPGSGVAIDIPMMHWRRTKEEHTRRRRWRWGFRWQRRRTDACVAQEMQERWHDCCTRYQTEESRPHCSRVSLKRNNGNAMHVWEYWWKKFENAVDVALCWVQQGVRVAHSMWYWDLGCPPKFSHIRQEAIFLATHMICYLKWFGNAKHAVGGAFQTQNKLTGKCLAHMMTDVTLQVDRICL